MVINEANIKSPTTAIHYNFWLNLYKPKGISSAKLVSIVKKVFPTHKVGHCGTLDVEAEGVLPIAVGEATKLVRVLVDTKKTYIFTIQFGKKTDTADSSGKVLMSTDMIPNYEQCVSICKNFTGILAQYPPAFSAIKVNGVRSYKLARQNSRKELPILAPRNITIYKLECLNFNPLKREATYKAECSKGTYIRTLGEDIALSLQSLAFVVELRRSKVGLFTASDAIKLIELDLTNQEIIRELLIINSIKIEAVLDGILVLDVTLEQATKIVYGQKCYFDHLNDTDLIWIRCNGKLLAIERKQQIIAQYAKSENDTGSDEVVCAILTERINNLTEHFKTNHKDFSSRRGLLMLVGRRRKLLNYIKKKSLSNYLAFINKLGIRK
ncbi:tRNA pseudouridine synthase B [Pseudolycoriella hygida]|uniref:tRNA pseudouridine(55) synthase n=1 Tax=Pseudolycoriella hygida TaxID=35572 RepID=A0A9Q0N8R5_9DIPT|nr:tRNA pseudouridine synthase B [Pseudolycoriella hygida]